MKKKYRMNALNTRSGSIIEVEFDHPKHFSNPAFDETLFLSENRKKTVGVFNRNAGARNFLDKIGRQFRLTENDIEMELMKLENRIFRRRKK